MYRVNYHLRVGKATVRVRGLEQACSAFCASLIVIFGTKARVPGAPY